MTGIIILNWNGYSDTIACLDSLYRMSSDFFAIVVDNGSSDGSLREISNFLDSRAIGNRQVGRGNRLDRAPESRECIVYDAGENLGFAKGNNEGLRLLADFMPDYLLLLNNDTIVEPDFLDILADYAVRQEDVDVMTPLICYNADRNKIWNCGGRLKYGFRKYYYASAPLDSLRSKESFDVTFVTGCALFFRPSVVLPDGGVFTERFFFGEEDFNFCLRMKREGRKMVCVPESKIYHKVNASTAKTSRLGILYIYYLNRFIDVRLNSSLCFYLLWSLLNVVYTPLLLTRCGHRFSDSVRLTLRAARNAWRKDTVSRADFTEALNRPE